MFFRFFFSGFLSLIDFSVFLLTSMFYNLFQSCLFCSTEQSKITINSWALIPIDAYKSERLRGLLHVKSLKDQKNHNYRRQSKYLIFIFLCLHLPRRPCYNTLYKKNLENSNNIK
jgi:hypothetical protein